MKIEKVSENQIRCTLTREDLVSRELKISELAYGTEKAKTLFRDMMQQANFEFGFEAEDIPLMIEAIPLNSECIVLIITKVEDPEELDTRFSRFAPSVMEDDGGDEDFNVDSPDEMLDLFRKLKEPRKQAEASIPPTAEEPSEKDRTLIFSMDSLRQVMNAAAVIGSHFHGFSSLYKDERTGSYLLLLTQGEETHEAFDRTCNILSEYGSLKQRNLVGNQTYLEEHYEPLIDHNALQALSGH
ncbi:MAG: adaptor protein MecA [Candidatus Gastranaerophilales bacterium]|nr:adaptor protein MecA [Candidatus Gastranaerophilales bacterium]